jgi:hypothetical protein
VQIPLDNERDEYENLKGKTQRDIEVGNNFGGDGEPAEQVFKQMAGQHDYQGFNFIPQKDSQTSSQVEGYQQRPSSVIVRNIRQNPNHWRFDEVIVNGERKLALVHHSVLDEEVDLNSQPVYLPEKFSLEEMSEIKRIKNIPENDENRRIIEGIKNDNER